MQALASVTTVRFQAETAQLINMFEEQQALVAAQFNRSVHILAELEDRTNRTTAIIQNITDHSIQSLRSTFHEYNTTGLQQFQNVYQTSVLQFIDIFQYYNHTGIEQLMAVSQYYSLKTSEQFSEWWMQTLQQMNAATDSYASINSTAIHVLSALNNVTTMLISNVSGALNAQSSMVRQLWQSHTVPSTVISLTSHPAIPVSTTFPAVGRTVPLDDATVVPTPSMVNFNVSLNSVRIYGATSDDVDAGFDRRFQLSASLTIDGCGTNLPLVYFAICNATNSNRPPISPIQVVGPENTGVLTSMVLNVPPSMFHEIQLCTYYNGQTCTKAKGATFTGFKTGLTFLTVSLL